MVEPITTGTARRSDAVAEELLAAVLDGRLPVGSALPPERDLAVRMGVARGSLRQAVTRLEQMGIVSAQQGRGTVVLDPQASSDPRVVSRLVRDLGPSILEELFELRRGLGALVGELAAARATARDVTDLRRAVAAVRRAPDAVACQRGELAFFSRLVAATGNRPLEAVMRWNEVVYGDAADRFVAAFADPPAVADELEPIVAAVDGGDALGAAAAVRDYATSSARRMLAAARGGP